MKTDALPEATIKYLHKLHTKNRLLYQMHRIKSKGHETNSNMTINLLVLSRKSWKIIMQRARQGKWCKSNMLSLIGKTNKKGHKKQIIFFYFLQAAQTVNSYSL